MNPRLAAIAGPFEGTTFPLVEGEFSIGRANSNRLPISDLSLSRQHCVIRNEAAGFTIRDLDSRNCTFVNNVPVKEKMLAEGDRIRVGKSLFVFLVDDRPEATAPVLVEENETDAPATVATGMDSAPGGRTDPSARPDPAVAAMARNLTALRKFSAVINSVRSIQELELRFLELVFEAVPAESGAILLGSRAPDEYASTTGWHRNSGARPVAVSNSVVRRAMRERAVVLVNDILIVGGPAATYSLVAGRVQSVLCAPLLLLEETLGAVYLQTTQSTTRFEDEHVQFLSAIAPIAAVALKNVMRLELLERENQMLRSDSEIGHEMVGDSAALQQVRRFIARVAPAGSTVLITGESGTGKELVARALHQNSPRADRPFVAINCAAIADTLLESELFGHEKGAFTGAVAQKKGKLETAEGGTVFLDEIGELALPLQAKILRVLQERELERVGSTRSIKIDLRLIAATNRNVEEAIQSGGFRKDLYYRLNVVSVEVPSLRERREDIPMLAAYFAAKFGERSKRHILGISDAARACLLAYDWPGNVRELENAIERAVVLGSGELIEAEDLPDSVVEARPPSQPAATLDYYQTVKEVKKDLILKALRQSDGSYGEAARMLGMHVNYLHRLIKNLDLKRLIRAES